MKCPLPALSVCPNTSTCKFQAKTPDYYSSVVSQFYVTEPENDYVIRGNAAIVRCKIPSFVSDFVQVESWLMEDGEILTINNTNSARGTLSEWISNSSTKYPKYPLFTELLSIAS